MIVEKTENGRGASLYAVILQLDAFSTGLLLMEMLNNNSRVAFSGPSPCSLKSLITRLQSNPAKRHRQAGEVFDRGDGVFLRFSFYHLLPGTCFISYLIIE